MNNELLIIIAMTKTVKHNIKEKYGVDVEPHWEFLARELSYRIVILKRELSVEHIVSEFAVASTQALYDDLMSKCVSAFNLKVKGSDASTQKDTIEPFFKHVCNLVSRCRYKPDWNIHALRDDKGVYLQLEVKNTPCSLTGQKTKWKSGKRYLSEFACDQEVVGSVFALIKDAEMHECHEWFRYRGASIYNPHLSPDALVEVASKKESFDTRPDSMERT